MYKLDVNTLINQLKKCYTEKFQTFTALHIAVGYQAYESFNKLIELGADVNMKNFHGMNALNIAGLLDIPGMVGTLLRHGADLLLPGYKNKMTGLESAVKANKNPETIKAMLDEGPLTPSELLDEIMKFIYPSNNCYLNPINKEWFTEIENIIKNHNPSKRTHEETNENVKKQKK